MTTLKRANNSQKSFESIQRLKRMVRSPGLVPPYFSGERLQYNTIALSTIDILIVKGNLTIGSVKNVLRDGKATASGVSSLGWLTILAFSIRFD